MPIWHLYGGRRTGSCLALVFSLHPCAARPWPRARSSAGEHYVDIVGVTGSIPVAPTIVFEALKKSARRRPVVTGSSSEAGHTISSAPFRPALPTSHNLARAREPGQPPARIASPSDFSGSLHAPATGCRGMPSAEGHGTQVVGRSLEATTSDFG